MAFDLLAQGSDPRCGLAWTIKAFTGGNPEKQVRWDSVSPWPLDVVEAET